MGERCQLIHCVERDDLYPGGVQNVLKIPVLCCAVAELGLDNVGDSHAGLVEHSFEDAEPLAACEVRPRARVEYVYVRGLVVHEVSAQISTVMPTIPADVLAEVFVEVADTLVDESDMVEFLQW